MIPSSLEISCMLQLVINKYFTMLWYWTIVIYQINKAITKTHVTEWQFSFELQIFPQTCIIHVINQIPAYFAQKHHNLYRKMIKIFLIEYPGAVYTSTNEWTYIIYIYISLSYPLFNIGGCMFWAYPIPSWWLREYIALSYYHHQIGSTNYYPLFRVRSWNNGMHCMSLYILIYVWELNKF